MTKQEKKIVRRICVLLLNRAAHCGVSATKNPEPYSSAFWVAGIVLTDLAETIKKELR